MTHDKPRTRQQSEATMFNLRVDRPAKDVALIVLAGEIDMASAPRLSTTLHRELDHHLTMLVLDLTAVTDLGRAGLQVLGVAAERAKTLAVDLKLIYGDPSPVHAAVYAAGLTETFPPTARLSPRQADSWDLAEVDRA